MVIIWNGDLTVTPGVIKRSRVDDFVEYGSVGGVSGLYLIFGKLSCSLSTKS